jgi:putative transposase
VWKVCSQNGWWSSFGKKKTRKKSAKVHTPAYDDLVRRHFNADAPNHLWLGDITEHPTKEGKLYICAIKDACSKRIVGYSIDERMKARLAVAAINNAVARRGDVAGCVFHTDRGSQFVPEKSTEPFPDTAWSDRWVRSGRVGSAGDNAAMESFFALLQKNVLNRKRVGHP